MSEPGAGVQCALHKQAIQDIKDSMIRIEVNHGAQLATINAQTLATNGRVRALERWKIGISAALLGLIAGTLGDGELLRKIMCIIAGGAGGG